MPRVEKGGWGGAQLEPVSSVTGTFLVSWGGLITTPRVCDMSDLSCSPAKDEQIEGEKEKKRIKPMTTVSNWRSVALLAVLLCSSMKG